MRLPPASTNIPSPALFPSGRLYMILAGGRNFEPGQPNVQKRFDSFQILVQPRAAGPGAAAQPGPGPALAPPGPAAPPGPVAPGPAGPGPAAPGIVPRGPGF